MIRTHQHAHAHARTESKAYSLRKLCPSTKSRPLPLSVMRSPTITYMAPASPPTPMLKSRGRICALGDKVHGLPPMWNTRGLSAAYCASVRRSRPRKGSIAAPVARTYAAYYASDARRTSVVPVLTMPAAVRRRSSPPYATHASTPKKEDDGAAVVTGVYDRCPMYLVESGAPKDRLPAPPFTPYGANDTPRSRSRISPRAKSASTTVGTVSVLLTVPRLSDVGPRPRTPSYPGKPNVASSRPRRQWTGP